MTHSMSSVGRFRRRGHPLRPSCRPIVRAGVSGSVGHGYSKAEIACDSRSEPLADQPPARGGCKLQGPHAGVRSTLGVRPARCGPDPDVRGPRASGNRSFVVDSEGVMDERLFELGLQKRRKVLWEEYVERSMAGADGFNREFQRFMTEYCWGGRGVRVHSTTGSGVSTTFRCWRPWGGWRSSSCISAGRCATDARRPSCARRSCRWRSYAGFPPGFRP